MSDANEQAAAFEAELIRKVSSCGVDASHLSLRYENYLQDYDLVVRSGPLTPKQIACINDVVGSAAILSFLDPENAAEHREAQSRKSRQTARELAKAMPGLPVYDPLRMTLAAFAREIEVYCGVEPGAVLKVVDDRLLSVQPQRGSC